MKRILSNYIRGFNAERWYWFYKKSQKSNGLLKELFTMFYMKMASNNGGYIGRETILHGPLILPHGFHGIHISREAEIGHHCTIYQNVTIGAGYHGAPRIGNNVYIGAGAILLGGGILLIM